MTRLETDEQRDFLDHDQCPVCGHEASWERTEEVNGYAYQRFQCINDDCEAEGCVDYRRIGHTVFRYGTTPTGRSRKDYIYRSTP